MPAFVDAAPDIAKRHEARCRSALSGLLVAGYRFRRLRGVIVSLCTKLEGGALYSQSLREILKRYHGVEIGAYSYGAILSPGVLPKGTIVGRYCSVGGQLIVRRRNHPIERPTQHPFFYNARLGYLNADTIQLDQENPLRIGHDVWIGDRVTVLSECREIGNGAIIAAGAIVTRDVPAYAVVAGVPARVIRSRFNEETAAALEASEWWNLPSPSLLEMGDLMLSEATPELAARLSGKLPRS